MPHIVIDASAPLLARIDWQPVLHELHQALAEKGWAALEDLKSRVQPMAHELSGSDDGAQQLIATLILTNPRPPAVCQRMAELVHAHLSRAIEAARPDAWVQCCLFLHEFPKLQYFKRQWNAPPPSDR